MGAAIVCGPMLAGCDGGQQSTSPVANPPKESPVLTTAKDSMNEFLNQNKKQRAAPKK
jgi:hypothetical protein